jgi:hypothetical protein
MPLYRIHRLKESQRSPFRAQPHTGGLTAVKPRDYEPGGEVEAASPYSAWRLLRGGEHPLHVGDVLESESGELCICKFVGFEDARWHVPEARPHIEQEPAEAGHETSAGAAIL